MEGTQLRYVIKFAGTVDKDNHNHPPARLPEVPRAVIARARADAARSASGSHGQMAP